MSSKQIPCRNFGTPVGCRFGDKCFYVHQTASVPAVKAINRPVPTNVFRAPPYERRNDVEAVPSPINDDSTLFADVAKLNISSNVGNDFSNASKPVCSFFLSGTSRSLP
jgi:hypothetical protein